MRTLILSGHSADNAALARLTAENKWEYGARHGYDLLTMRLSWEEAKGDFLPRLRDLLTVYDRVMTVGSDVLFMNPAIRIEDVARPEDNIVMAMERLGPACKGWSSVNNDVMIWTATTATGELLDRLIGETEKWLQWPQLWQRQMDMMLRKEPEEFARAVRLVKPRVMNASRYPGMMGINRWEPGDWIFHALGGTLEEKMGLVGEYLAKAGESPRRHEGTEIAETRKSIA